MSSKGSNRGPVVQPVQVQPDGNNTGSYVQSTDQQMNGQQSLMHYAQYGQKWTPYSFLKYGENLTDQDNHVVSNDYGFNGNTPDRQGSVTSQCDNSSMPILDFNLDEVLYGSCNQSQESFGSDQVTDPYEYSVNFTETTVQQMTTPVKATAMVVPSVPIAPQVTQVQQAVSNVPQSKKHDPEYAQKRQRNNEAARASRKKKKQNYEEMVAKCQRKKEKIQLLRALLDEEKKAKEHVIMQRDVLKVTLDGLQKKLRDYEANDDVQVLAMPSCQGFGGEKSQDFTDMPIVNMGRRRYKH